MKTPGDATSGTNASAANYNTLIARAWGMRPSSAGELAAATTPGVDGVTDQRLAGYPDNTGATAPTLLDSNHDWRDRILWIRYTDLSAATNRPGGTTDYTEWSTLGGMAFAMGYTGTGAYSNVGAGPAAVGAGAPPLGATGAAGTSYRIRVMANVWLYVLPADGKLYLFNNTGAAVHLVLWIEGTADLGAH